MARAGGLVTRVIQEVEDRTGYAVTPAARLDLLEARAKAYGETRRELDLLGWSVLDYINGNPQELTPEARKKWVQQARMVWRQDPQAGAAVDLLNDFVFGRGVPKPRAKDEEVQEVIDEFWDDPDNQLALTSYEAQLALGTDLTLQCNLFLLVFEGEDGKVKLGLLNHDEVITVVRDPENRLRALYFMAAHVEREWDFETDTAKVNPSSMPKKVYYEHWRNMEDLREDDSRDTDKLTPPKDKLGDGKVYHVAVNRTSEEVFGNPSMRRLIRWFSAYNDFLSARVDMAQAAAAYIMRRKIRGTPNQVAKMAAQAISRTSELAGVTGTGDSPPQRPPHGGSIITENENVTHEALNLNSNSGNAMGDAQMIRAAISAGVRFPQSYLGDPSNSNLATATSLELPVLKGVENRQEIFESIFRWALDLAIEKAVDSGRLSKTVASQQEPDPNELGGPDDTGPYGPDALDPNADTQEARRLAEYDGEAADEAETERDLSYELSMPNPLKRMLTDLTGSIAQLASTFDPNGSNTELSRILLTIALGEGLEMQDPAEAVRRIFPDGYVDPAIAAAQAQAEAAQTPQVPPNMPPDPNAPGVGAGGQQPGRAAPGTSQQYQDNQGQMQQATLDESWHARAGQGVARRDTASQGMEAPVVVHGRDGRPLVWRDGALREARFADLPDSQRHARQQHIDDTARIVDEEIELASTALGRRLANGFNGNGGGR